MQIGIQPETPGDPFCRLLSTSFVVIRPANSSYLRLHKFRALSPQLLILFGFPLPLLQFQTESWGNLWAHFVCEASFRGPISILPVTQCLKIIASCFVRFSTCLCQEDFWTLLLPFAFIFEGYLCWMQNFKLIVLFRFFLVAL